MKRALCATDFCFIVSLQQNYTEIGFKKIRAPEKVFKLIKDFWDANKEIQSPENWGKGNTYTNNWVAPTYMVSVENSRLRGGGAGLKNAIWDAARDTIQEWTGGAFLLRLCFEDL